MPKALTGETSLDGVGCRYTASLSGLMQWYAGKANRRRTQCSQCRLNPAYRQLIYVSRSTLVHSLLGRFSLLSLLGFLCSYKHSSRRNGSECWGQSNSASPCCWLRQSSWSDRASTCDGDCHLVRARAESLNGQYVRKHKAQIGLAERRGCSD